MTKLQLKTLLIPQKYGNILKTSYHLIVITPSYVFSNWTIVNNSQDIVNTFIVALRIVSFYHNINKIYKF